MLSQSKFLFVVLVAFLCGIKAQRSVTQASQEDFQKHESDLAELKKMAADGGHPNPDSITTFDPDVCYSLECLEAAKEIMYATNFTVDPCTNGNWLTYTCVRRTMQVDNNDELNDMHQQGQVGYLGFVSLGQTMAILESKNLPPEVKKAAFYYEQCEQWRHKTDNITQIDGIVKYLNKLGEWPLLTGSDSPGNNFDWKELMASAMRMSVAYGVAPYLFDMFIEDGDVPLLFTGELALHMDNEEVVEIIRVLSKDKRIIPATDNQINEMIDFMGKLTHPAEDKIEAHPIKNITANHDFGNFDLQEFYRQMLSGTRIHLTPESEVAADIEWLKAHLKAVNEANPRVIANILFLQIATGLLNRLTTLTHADDLPNLEKYQSSGPPDCVRETYEKFDYAMSYEFIQRNFDHNATPILMKLTDDLKEGYGLAIENAKFLTSQTKVFVWDKISDIHTFIAAEDWVMDGQKIKDYYKNLNFSDQSDFVENHVTALGFHWSKFLDLQNPNIFNYLVGDAYTGHVSTRYNHHFNQIRIQAAIAQKPLFSPKYPGFMNYGGIGTVIGHELGHSFDTNGIHFNKYGQQGDFWDDVSYESYYNWTESLISDYSGDRYKSADPWGSMALANVDHSEAVNDDIADIVGVYMSYNAYLKYLADLEKDNKKEAVLPGLKQFTPQQLFWMKYTNMWCEHADKSYLHALRHFSLHSPGNMRATLPLTRSQQWANDFKCPAPTKSDF